MTVPSIPRAGLVFAGNHPEGEPGVGLERALRLFELSEQLGYDVAGIRQRHLERGVSSALPFLAAASQRTRVIRLESDVVPLGYETPFRLAEDFGTVDALSGGRLNVGISTSSPHGDLLAALGRSDAAVDPYALIERFLEALEGRALADDPLSTPYGPQVPRIEPHVPGLRDRVWLGGGSTRSVSWAARHGLKLLLGNLTDAGAHDAFEPAQRDHIDQYYAEFAGDGEPVVGVERVIVPTDSATAEQRAHYAEYAASRHERTVAPAVFGSRRVAFQRDLIGSSEEIIERLRDDPSIDGRTELRVALPYGFADEEYRQILADIRHAVLPALGWRPARAVPAAAPLLNPAAPPLNPDAPPLNPDAALLNPDAGLLNPAG
ncbi:LLM class flavin-dependent oxidoreductase [Microbacterium sp. No. 7]|uniref:LLM class flavin-dependent oxidoreductase n=1 Tax=Microbacterium sp. No. 7 TaxID=1714373 RepID=UPI0006D2B4CA|nr:LLM class flavin-dependent oxidoreductase [Microbacterium sp. No. 7]